MFVGASPGLEVVSDRAALLVLYAGAVHVLAVGKVALELGSPEPPLPLGHTEPVVSRK